MPMRGCNTTRCALSLSQPFMRRFIFISIGLLAILAGVIYFGDYIRDKDSGGWSGFSYWNYRRAPSGLPRPLFAVRVGGRFGFIDANGQMVIDPKFERVGRFQEGLCVATESGRDGYIDATGAWIITARFAAAGSFREGRAVVRESDKGGYGYIDRTGMLVISHQYDAASDFVDGVARVGHATKLGKLKGSIADVGVECWYEYIDPQGRRVAKPAMNNPPPINEPGPLMPFGVPGKMGYKDASGRVIVEPIFDRADPFEDGMGCVGSDGGRKNGYVDATGRVVWTPSE